MASSISQGIIIFLNGTSSAGKSTIATELQQSLPQPFMHISLDTYLNQLSPLVLNNQQLMISLLPRLLDGFNYSVAAIASKGNNCIIDHVLQEPEWVHPCVEAFEDLEVYFIKVYCPLEILVEREKVRGDRHIGMAEYQYSRVHHYNSYDAEVDTSVLSAKECAQSIINLLDSSQKPTAFEQIRKEIQKDGF